MDVIIMCEYQPVSFLPIIKQIHDRISKKEEDCEELFNDSYKKFDIYNEG